MAVVGAGRWWGRAPGRGRPQPLALSLSPERTQTTQCTITRKSTCSWGGREREEGEAASGASRRGKAGMPVVARRPTPTAATARPTASLRAMEPPCKPGIAHLAAGGLGRGGGPARGAGWEPRAGGRTPGRAARGRAPPPARCGRRAKLHRPRRSARRPGAWVRRRGSPDAASTSAALAPARPPAPVRSPAPSAHGAVIGGAILAGERRAAVGARRGESVPTVKRCRRFFLYACVL